MVFLEAWLAGKQLVGRALPGIVEEFEQAGLRFDGLRQTLDVPLAWLPDRSKLAEALCRAYVWVCETYGVDPDPEQENRARQLASDHQKTIDFALLPSKFQQQIIRQSAAEPAAARAELESFNPGITTDWKHHTAADEQIAANSAMVRSTYSLQVVGRRLHDVYQALAASPIGDLQPLFRGEAILKSFLNVDRLHAIRFEE